MFRDGADVGATAAASRSCEALDWLTPRRIFAEVGLPSLPFSLELAAAESAL